MLDLTPDQLVEILEIVATHAPGCSVFAFGSRATDRAWKHSDLDLAIDCHAPLGLGVRARLREAFEESSLPFRVDIVDLHDIDEHFRALIEPGLVALDSAAPPSASSRAPKLTRA